MSPVRTGAYWLLLPEFSNPFDRESANAGERFYRNFNPRFVANAANGGPHWMRVLHALRRGHADTLKQNGVSPGLIEDIHGREGASVIGIRYANSASLPLLADLLSKYSTVTGHLAQQPARLVGFVEAKETAPWFENPDEKRGRRGK